MATYPGLFTMNRRLRQTDIKRIQNIFKLRVSGMKLLAVHGVFNTCFTSGPLIASCKELWNYLFGLDAQDLPIMLISTIFISLLFTHCNTIRRQNLNFLLESQS